MQDLNYTLGSQTLQRAVGSQRGVCEQERPGSVSDAARTRAGPDGGSRELAHHPIYYRSYLFTGDVPQGLGHPLVPCRGSGDNEKRRVLG